MLEEPPERALLLLVSHAPGRVLPTIRSRCRRLLLRPLETADVARAVAAATGRDADEARDRARRRRRRRQRGARALRCSTTRRGHLRQRVLDLFAQLPDPDPRALHALGDALGGSEPQTLATFIDMVNAWLVARLDSRARETTRLERVSARACDKINRAARDADAYNLERKPLVFAVFGLLAEAARAKRVQRADSRAPATSPSASMPVDMPTKPPAMMSLRK